MTNEEKAQEIARSYPMPPSSITVSDAVAMIENGASQMAEWKDQQFKELLYKWLNDDGKIDITKGSIDELLKEIDNNQNKRYGKFTINIYKDKLLEKSYSTTQENFKKIHTALIELSKEESDLSFSFGFDGFGNILEMERDVANKAFKCINKPSEQQQPTADAVNHPTHYNSHPSGIECIDVVRYFNFPIGNVIKYCWRAGLKKETDTTEAEMELKDLKKARWYLDDYIKHLEKGIKK